MRPFTVAYTGDFRDVDGRPIGDLATDLLDPHPWLRYRFLGDLAPTRDDDGYGYTDRLYHLEITHLEITADHVRSHNAIIICRPWLRASAFASGAADLVAIRTGRHRRGQARPRRVYGARRGGVQRPARARPLHLVGGGAVHAGAGQAAADARPDRAHRRVGPAVRTPWETTCPA